MFDIAKYVLNKAEGNKVNHARVYGVLTEMTNLSSGCSVSLSGEDMHFVMLKTLAVKLPKKYSTDLLNYGMYADDSIFECDTELPVLVRDADFTTYIGQYFVAVDGDIRVLPNSSTVGMLTYKKSSTGGWVLTPQEVNEASEADFARGTKLYSLFKRGSLTGILEHTFDDTMPVAKSDSSDTNVRVMQPSIKKTNITNRDTLAERNESVTQLQEKVKQAEGRVSVFVSTEKYKESNKYYLSRLLSGLRRNILGYGSELLKGYILATSSEAYKKYQGTPIYQIIIDNFALVERNILYKEPIYFDEAVTDVIEVCFNSTQQFYFSIVEQMFSIESGTFRYAYRSLDNAITILNENPYRLFSYGVPYRVLQQMARVFRVTEQEAWVSDALIDDCLYNEDASTLTLRSNIVLNQAVKSCTSFEQEMGRAYFGVGIKTYTPCKLATDVNSRLKYISDYINHGFGIEIDKFIAPYFVAKMELYTYERLYNMAQTPSGLTEEAIVSTLHEYEASKGITLEKEQIDACKLLKYKCACITGCAGSGKTTTVDAMIYILRKLSNLQDSAIHLTAPTGKASKRMEEILHLPARTLHSMFKLGICNRDDRTLGINFGTFFIDECSMIPLSLMYRVVKSISPTSSLYLIGDINQLPPIGKGLPFRDAMGYLPTQILGVSKRAIDGSVITKNADIILNNSEYSDFKCLVSARDCLLAQVSNDNITEFVEAVIKASTGACDTETNQKLCFGNLSSDLIPKYSLDDIQVISPVSKVDISWGAVALNRRLQRVFNPGADGYVFNEILYQIGDRVIHTGENSYYMPHYRLRDDTFVADTSESAEGISNGEVGKIVGICSAYSMNIVESEDLSDRLRRNIGWEHSFLIVRYEDILGEGKDKYYYILYRCKQNGNQLSGGDMNLLDLFYAGTVHKTQGSQYPLTIFVVGKRYMPNFLSRNMIYTGLTRASKMCIVVGDVCDKQGTLNTARRTEVVGNILTLLQYIS